VLPCASTDLLEWQRQSPNTENLVSYFSSLEKPTGVSFETTARQFFSKGRETATTFPCSWVPSHGVTTMVNTHMNTDLNFTNYVKLVGVFAEGKKNNGVS
jgi:hypothetical protein